VSRVFYVRDDGIQSGGFSQYRLPQPPNFHVTTTINIALLFIFEKVSPAKVSRQSKK
jgi:hypothetical protein